MDYYSAMISLAGDRNQVVHKRDVSAAELAVLQAIHGVDSVRDIEKTGTDRTPHETIKQQLQRTYGKTKTGPDSDRKPVLIRTFTGWPNNDLPTTAKQAGISELYMKGKAETETTNDKDDNEPKPVTQNTYWRAGEGEEVVYDMTPKGDVLPEGAIVMLKKDWEAEQQPDNDFTE